MGLIYLDACVVIYLIEGHDRWGEIVADALAQASEATIGVSPLVKCECLVGPIRRGDLVLRRRYDEFFEQLVPLAMPEPVYLQAAELRARFGIRTPDALHLAAAQYHRCDALWTNDNRLARASHGLALNLLQT